MLNSGFSDWPSFSLEEAEAVRSVLLSNKVNYWTGQECRNFEKEFAVFAGVEHAVAVANGTVALDLALKVLDLCDGDEVVVTPRTYFATVSSIVNAGLTPVFADINPISQNVDADTIERVISNKTKALICVHLAGWPCEMDPIMKLAKKFDLYVIEDCAQAHGAKYKGKSVGSIGDIGCWSFCQDKIITTGGEGGMVTTNNVSLWDAMWSFKDHGKSWNAIYKHEHSSGFRWVHDTFGSNWRMTEIQGAIGRLQLSRLESWQAQRNAYSKQIKQAANETKHLFAYDLSCMGCHGSCDADTGCRDGSYKCYVFVNGVKSKRDQIMNAIGQEGVPCFQGTCPEVYLEKAFEKTTFRPKQRLPVAKKLGDTSLMFMCHPTLTQAEIDHTCATIIKIGNSEDFNQ